jgi:hypothetical protein
MKCTQTHTPSREVYTHTHHLVKRTLEIFLSRSLSPLDLVFASQLHLVQLETVIIYNLAERLRGWVFYAT